MFVDELKMMNVVSLYDQCFEFCAMEDCTARTVA